MLQMCATETAHGNGNESNMKIRCLLLMLVLAFAGGVLSAQTSSRSGAGKDAFGVPADSITVDISLQRAPVYSVDSKRTRLGAGNVPDNAKQWLVNDISFRFNSRSGRDAGPVLLYGLKVVLCLYVPASGGGRGDSQLFFGMQELHCVLVDPAARTRRFWASLFMPPNFVYAFFPEDRNGKYNLRALEGAILIVDRNGVILGRKAFAFKGKVSNKQTAALLDAVEKFNNAPGSRPVMLWPREKTPWAWVDADRYELPAVNFSFSNTGRTVN